jgi:hypothetical protein
MKNGSSKKKSILFFETAIPVDYLSDYHIMQILKIKSNIAKYRQNGRTDLLESEFSVIKGFAFRPM